MQLKNIYTELKASDRLEDICDTYNRQRTSI